MTLNTLQECSKLVQAAFKLARTFALSLTFTGSVLLSARILSTQIRAPTVILSATLATLQESLAVKSAL